MAQAASISTRPAAANSAASLVTEIPWYVWTTVAATTATTFGIYWDISWHMTIGRDTFWTPAHIAVQLGGLLAGLSCAYLIFATTFGKDAGAREASVSVWGFRGPLGAFIVCWGAATMIVSAPFDNWWHNSFGLDIEILSPPHTVLGVGMLGNTFGALTLIAGNLNRAQGETREKLLHLFLYVGGVMVFARGMLILEYSQASEMHSALFYRFAMFAFPMLFIALARAAGEPYAATKIAAGYMSVWAALLWIFPLFPAQPKLGPVLTNVTHMIPLWFPLLLVFPALAVDYLLARFAPRRRVFLAVILGMAFLLVFFAVQWPFAKFLVSPLARNGIFGMNYFTYLDSPSDYHYAYEFYYFERTKAAFWLGIGIALLTAISTSWVGLVWGDWMKRLRR